MSNNNSDNTANKFSVESLFPTSVGENSYTYGKFDVNTLFDNIKFGEEKEQNFDSDILLKNILTKRENIRKSYVKMFNLCCLKIKMADGLGKTDLIFELPEVIIDFTEISRRGCLQYISNRLRKQHLDTFVINNSKIFITWKFIELNKEKNKH